MTKYNYTDFKELFHDHIAWSFDSRYPVRFFIVPTLEGHIEGISFYKLELRADGQGSYKDDYFTFDPKLWIKIKAQAELLKD